MTWVIVATSTGLGGFGRAFLHHFLSSFDRRELRRVLRAAAEYRLIDENVREEERQAIRRLIALEGV